MGWLGRLLDRGSTPKAAAKSNTAQESSSPYQYEPSFRAFMDQAALAMEQLNDITDAAMKIIHDYAGVLITLSERSKRTGFYLFPESMLPYPKDVIHHAFAIIFYTMDRYNLRGWSGVPKDTFLSGALAIENYFAPDDRVPKDSHENFLASLQWQRKVNPPYDFKVPQSVKSNPEKWVEVFENMGVSKEISEKVVQVMIKRADREK